MISKKLWNVKFGCVSALALAAALSGAQTHVTNGLNQQTGLDVRLGTFLPTSTAGSNIGKNWFAVGIDYKLNSASATNPVPMGMLPSFLSLSLDYFSKNSVNTIPLILNYNLKMDKISYFVGAGVQDSSAGSGSSSKISLALDGGASYTLIKKPIPIFLEGKYFYSNYEALRGVGVYVGARF